MVKKILSLVCAAFALLTGLALLAGGGSVVISIFGLLLLEGYAANVVVGVPVFACGYLLVLRQ